MEIFATFLITVTVTILFTVLPTVESANIVFFFGVSSYSHRVPAWPLALALAEQNNVTFISPYPAKSPHPKIHDYVPTSLKRWVDEEWEDLEDVFDDRKKGLWLKGWHTLPMFGIMLCEILYEDKEYINWVKTSKVDLVILDPLANDCAYGMIHYWKAKTILFGTTAAYSYSMEPYGIPPETSWIPSMELFYPAEMSLKQRMTNALVPIVWDFFRRWTYFPRLEELTREKLGVRDLPGFDEIERNTSMVFLNSYHAEEFPRPLGPNTILIGGIANTDKKKPLPKELEEFLNKGDGFIFMSFGSYADFSRMDVHTQQAFITTMREYPNVQFVWKVGNLSLAQEFPKEKVYISDWLPQPTILAHPKIKAFITHSGMLGIQEAVHNGVPLISAPIFAEQDWNAERIHRKEYGIRLEITTVTEADLKDAITRILTDPKYRNNMKTLSTLFKDRPQAPLDTAKWWTEFVLRHTHDELASLRPLSVNQSWWVKRQLDAWAIIIGTIAVICSCSLYILYKLIQCAFGVGFKNANKSNHKKKVQ